MKQLSSLNNLMKNVPLWGFWSIFVFALGLVSYTSLALPLKMVLVFLVIFVPLLMVIVLSYQKKSPWVSSLKKADEWLHFGLVGGIVFAGLLIASRFIGLTKSPSWPIMDEGRNAFFSMELQHQWSWRLLWGDPQEEPLLNWFLGLCFRLFDPSFPTIRIFSAVISLLTLGAAYGAVRQYFSRSFSTVFVMLLAFSFWPFTFSRFLLRVTLLLLFEFILLWLLALLIKAKKDHTRWILAFGLGVVAGLGFYTYTAWLPIVVFAVIVLMMKALRENAKQRLSLFILVLISSLIALPLALARLQAGGTDFVLSCFKPAAFFQTFIDYVVGIFAYGFHSVPYGPNWGGLLNPILGAFVLIGLLTIFIQKKQALVLWVGFAFCLALLPGAVTDNIEMHRITPVLPLVLLLAVWGIECIFNGLPVKKRYWVAAALVLSVGLDIYHFIGPYQDRAALPEDRLEWRSVERQRAYVILQRLNKVEGPVAVLMDLYPGSIDQTLKVAVYPFDPTQNPKLSMENCHWTALVVNSNYEPFLKARFPKSQLIWLAPDIPSRNGGLLLALIPIDPENKDLLAHWIRADAAMRGITSLLMHHRSKEPTEPLKGAIEDIHALFQGDPFLEDAYWEKIGMVDAINMNLDQIIFDCRQALLYGYPSANIYNELGVYLTFKGDKDAARESFKKAIRCAVNRTPAAARLSQLDQSC